MLIWFELLVGAIAIVAALIVRLPQLQRLRQWRRLAGSVWSSVALVALGLCAWFAAAASLSAPHTAGRWGLLIIMASLFAICSAIIAAVQVEARNRSEQ